ncbi:MAG: hypothetical protein GY849_05885 [Deltaproteobacteria bacterium]|nr:hypothetical protein [Deltaproteobacteria bacterium]
MAIGGVDVGKELLNVPMGEMIRSMALAIAEAQWELDKSSMTVAELMSGQRLLRDLDSGKLIDGKGEETATPVILDSRVYFGYDYDDDGKRVPQKASMIELGFVPNFYQFVETILEVKITVKISGSTETSQKSSQHNQVDDKSKTATSGGAWGWWSGHGGASVGSGGGWRYGRNDVDRKTVSTSQVDGGYSNKYNYSVEGSSRLQTKLVPVPVPAILEERIRNQMEIERIYQERIATGLGEARKLTILKTFLAGKNIDVSSVDTVDGALGLSGFTNAFMRDFLTAQDSNADVSGDKTELQQKIKDALAAKS